MVKLKKKTGKKSKESAAKPTKLSDSARAGRVEGKKSGLNVSGWWNKMFRANAKAKLTDKELLSAFKIEFPKRTPQPVGQVRSFFNRSISGFGSGDGKRQTTLSIAYDKDGKETPSDWTRTTKPNPKRAKMAQERALKGWKKKDRKKRVDARGGPRVPVHVKAGKAKSKKLAAKKAAKPAAAKKPSPAGKTKGKFKLKIGGKKAA